MAIKDYLDDVEKISARHTADYVEYNLSSVESAITALKEAKDLLEITIPADLKNIDAKKKLWSGQSKEQFNELVTFYKTFQKDYKSSVKKYHTAVKGLKKVAGHIPESKVIKEVENL